MNVDISHILDQWDYQPGQVVVRRFTGKDGVDKLQLRVDLGLLQMNAEGRPDGKHPLGHASLFDHYQARLAKHLTDSQGSHDGFALKAEDCIRLQVEALQYHHRYICLLQLEDYPGVVRDTERNLAVLEFVTKYAESPETAWTVMQFKPQLLMIHTRAKVSQLLQDKDYDRAIRHLEDGISRISDFYREYSRNDLLEQSAELDYLQKWLDAVSADRPLTKREKLERALREAVKREDYKRAAQMRDAIRSLNPAGEK
jgi:hypothetical protein